VHIKNKVTKCNLIVFKKEILLDKEDFIGYEIDDL